MNCEQDRNLKKSDKAKNLENYFISNHRVSINRNQKFLEEIKRLDKDRRESDKHSNSSRNLTAAKVKQKF